MNPESKRHPLTASLRSLSHKEQYSHSPATMQGESSVSASLDRAPEYQPVSFAGDVINAVNQYAADGTDAFEACVLTSLPLTEAQEEEVLQGSAQLYSRLQASLHRQLGNWERFAVHTCLAEPAGVDLRQETPNVSMPLVDEEVEAQLDIELHRAREDIRQAKAATRHLQQQTAALDKELRMFGGAQQLAVQAGQQAGGKENLVQDAAAIASAALKLQPLLAKAAQLRRKHESRALAGATGANAAVTAEKEVIRRKAAVGLASTQDLQHLMARLGP